MNTKITLTIFENAEAWLRKNVPDLGGDAAACVRPIEDFHPDGFTRYEDMEAGGIKKRTLAHHVRALQLLSEQVGRTLFVGGIKSPFDLQDTANWDVEVVDAFWQLVYRGKCIYG